MRFLATLLFVTALSVSAQDAPKQGGGRGPGGPPKNLKVLKSVEEERAVMGAMRASIGEGCNFCHVQDRASDELPKKLVARQMMEMVNEINAKFPDGKAHVTCYTCHPGKTMPEMAPPPAQ